MRHSRRGIAAAAIAAWMIGAALLAPVARAIAPPSGVTVADTPNDPGRSIDVAWVLSPDDRAPAPGESLAVHVLTYGILRRSHPDSAFKEVGNVLAGVTVYTDSPTRDGTPYTYEVESRASDGSTAASAPAGPVTSSGQFFDTRKSMLLALMVLFCGAVIFLIQRARAGKELFIRPIPGLAAVDEAIGRATEMGRPILFVPGLGSDRRHRHDRRLHDARRAWRRRPPSTRRSVLVPCYDPMVMTMAQEIVKSSYLDAGLSRRLPPGERLLRHPGPVLLRRRGQRPS